MAPGSGTRGGRARETEALVTGDGGVTVPPLVLFPGSWVGVLDRWHQSWTGGPPCVCLFGLGEMLGAKLSISPTTNRLVSIKSYTN